MEHKIYQEIEPVAEAMNLLWAIASKQNFTERKEEKARIIPFNARCEQIYAILENIESDTKNALKDVWADVLYYFVSDKEDHEFPAKTLFLWDVYNPIHYDTPQKWADSIIQMDETSYYQTLYRRLCVYNESVEDTIEVEIGSTLTDIIQFILNMNISNGKKLTLQDIIINRKEHFKKVVPLLQTAMRQLEKHQKEIQILLKQFYQYWTDELQNMSFPEYMEQLAHTHLDNAELRWSLRPALFFPCRTALTLNINEHTGESTSPYLGNVGVLFGDGFSMKDYFEKQSMISDEQAIKILKLISEKNKMEILALAKSTPAYGSMLAQHLGLTTATISHHTNELYEANLLKVERKGNRIYYSTNQETLEKLIAFLQKKLTLYSS